MKNINEYKFIINSGCSYGQMIESIKRPIESGIYDNLDEKISNKIGKSKWFITNDKVVTIDVALPSQGAQWISDSIIHTVEFLLNNGVNPENIYCFIEWSQWSRVSFEPFHYTDCSDLTFLDKKNFELKVLGEEEGDYFLSELFKELGILFCNEHHNIGKIGDMVYINPTHTQLGDMPKSVQLFLEKVVELELLIPEEKKIKMYIDYLLKTQYFLKSKNVKYNYAFMQGSLTGWYLNDYGFGQFPETNHDNNPMKLTDDFILINRRFKSYFTKEYDVENVVKSIRKDFKNLDFSNIWLYESKSYRRGGFDEWCMDNFGMGSMTQSSVVREFLIEKSPFRIGETPTSYNHHPNVSLYKLLWNTIAVNCDFLKIDEDWMNEIVNLINEDLESNKDTKHGIVLSRKYLKENTNYKYSDYI